MSCFIRLLLLLLLFGGSIAIIAFLLFESYDEGVSIPLIIALIITIILTIVFNTHTKIHFSKEYIKVRYGWLPYVRKRNTKNFKSVNVQYNDPSSDSAGGGFNYVVLVFSNQWNIKIMMDQLSRQESDFLIGRLNYLKSIFANDQYVV
jgi:cell division protein FtsW (lipid II flippase)